MSLLCESPFCRLLIINPSADPIVAGAALPPYRPRLHTMSADLVWMLTRKQNCFIRQKKGSGGDQLVRPRARANRASGRRSGPPWRSGCSAGRWGCPRGRGPPCRSPPRFPWLTVRCVLAAQFTNEPNNLMQKHSYKYSGLVSRRAFASSPEVELRTCPSAEEDPCARAPPHTAADRGRLACRRTTRSWAWMSRARGRAAWCR